MGNLAPGGPDSVRAFLFPGQGSQRRGMGAGLFERFPEECALADRIAGTSLRELCLEDPGDRLRSTRWAQPALFLVNALSYLERRANGERPDFLAGHSLGELNALFAAGCFDLETGLLLVTARSELMAAASGGAMMAVIGLTAERLTEALAASGIDSVDVANYNAPDQIVLAGPGEALSRLAPRLVAAAPEGRTVRTLPLAVAAAFHSRSMVEASHAFEEVLGRARFAPPTLPVIANVTARPYRADQLPALLSAQIRSPVRWWEAMRYLQEQGVEEVEELGPGGVLTKLWRSAFPAPPSPPRLAPRPVAVAAPEVEPPPDPCLAAERLGSASFRRDYGLRYAYLAGSMYQGIASTRLLIRLARNGLMGFFGTGGLGLAAIEAALQELKRELGPRASWGANLLYPLDEPELEAATVELLLAHDVRFVEAAAYLRITAPLVRCRFRGARFTAAGEPVAGRRVLAKVSRPEIATLFLRPPPEEVLAQLVASGGLGAEEAAVARCLPVASELCVEADSGGHTDAGRAYALMPAMLQLREEMRERGACPADVPLGAAGGIGSPEAAAAAFVLGADFVLTGSVNQCSPEAGTSEAVKDLLAQLDVQDTAYTAAGDMFELGARVQVASRGTLFAARANKLFQLYRQHRSLDELDQGTRKTLEERYFKRSLAQVWSETCDHLASTRPEQIEQAERDPRHKMALVFNWYFAHTSRWALAGSPERVNYQIHCGPAMGAFNRSVRGTPLEPWRERHVERIAEHLMRGAATVLGRRLEGLLGRSDPPRLAQS
ncbi:MAG TPA: ACP S-malonyltransferase [Thermoanaerobaculia bacterium]|nr:ACP S-malonyltransferase [Thermoanaerobaculia bacterium]